MKLYEALELKLDKGDLISIVGGGGKTTTMYKLAGELKSIGKRVLVTTTTAILAPELYLYDSLLLYNGESSRVETLRSSIGHITVLGSTINKEGKLLGVEPEEINRLINNKEYDVIIVEADGSKGRPIKAPAQHEPVIPSSTTAVVGVIGLDSLGKRISEATVHRPELFSAITDGEIQGVIDEEKILKLVTHKEGLFKGTPEMAKKFLLLNKEDQISKEDLVKLVAKLELVRYQLSEIIIASHLSNSLQRWSDLID